MAEEKPKSDFSDPREDNPCIICGGTSYQWGRARAEGGVVFVPEGEAFGFGGGIWLDGRKCVRCGNVQLFTRE